MDVEGEPLQVDSDPKFGMVGADARAEVRPGAAYVAPVLEDLRGGVLQVLLAQRGDLR